MATTATQSYVDAQKVLEGYRTFGVSQAESDKFVQGAIDALEEDKGTFAENVAQVATWAVQIDEAFDRVTRGLTALTAEFSGTFPKLVEFRDEWKDYNSRWVSHLALSRDVASEHASVLNRFDKVFLDMVEQIRTNQDRLDVIAELGQFANEDHDRSTEMSQGFLNLKRDVEDFVVRFDAWIEKTGTELQERAKQLQGEINDLKTVIESLDGQVRERHGFQRMDLNKLMTNYQIKEATKAVLASAAGAATMFGVIGLIVAGTTLAVLIAQRAEKQKTLASRQKELDEVNKQQKALAKVKSDFDGLKPDIALICAKLILFAEIWSSVRSQAVQFQETLKGGMGALTNMRFKQELRLARELCTPLKNGLEKYATALVNRP